MSRILLVVFLICCAPLGTADETRIVSLAPHLTEWVYSLEQEQALIAASAYSNYPASAKQLPRVADYRGADLSAIAALSPSLILAWDGGNRPQDIARLKSLGYDVFTSRIDEPADIADELERLAARLETAERGKRLAAAFRDALQTLYQDYHTTQPIDAFYYSWQTPLMSIGSDAWPNKLLRVCGAETLFADSPSDYPQVSLHQVIRRQPDVIIAASNDPVETHQRFWSSHREVLDAPLITVNPDITSRFTLRLIPELRALCETLQPYVAN